MRLRSIAIVGAAVAFSAFAVSAPAKEVVPMYGGTLIEGYDFGKDIGPKGSFNFKEDTGEFVGSYTGLKTPESRHALFAWLHDTVNQKSLYVGPVGLLKTGTGGKNKGRFKIAVPEEFRKGDFGSYEILAISAEKSDKMDAEGKVVSAPSEPQGSERQKALKPAFYLFAALPGADTPLHYCGHGQDFFHAKAPEKQVCYD